MMKDSLDELSASIVDAISEPLLFLDAELRVVAANQAFYQTFQVSAQAITHCYVYDLEYSPWDLPELRATLEKVLIEDVPIEDFEVTHEYPAIGCRTLLLSAHQITVPESKATLLLLRFEDVTERKRLEGLHDSEPKYQHVFEAALDILMLTDSQGNILDINHRAEEITGYSQAELRHMNVFQGLYIPEDQPKMRQVIHDLMEGRNREYDVRWRAKDGAVVHLAGVSTARFSVQGAFLSTICALRDMTERQQAEEALRRSEDRFRALVEHSLDAILLYSAEGITLYASPSISQINGYSPQELLGLNRFDWIHPDDLEQARQEWSALVQQPGKIVKGQARGRHRNGSWLWLERVFHNLLADPSVGAIVVNLRDITERKEAEEALRQSELKYRSIFEGAHDIILRLDKEGNILDINRRAEEITGYSQAELRHMNVFPDLYVPEDRPKMRQVLDDLIKGQNREFDVRWRAKDGHTIYFEGASEPFFAANGDFISTICTFRDVTERRQTQKALQQYTLRLQILHEIDEAILAARSLSDITEKVLYRVLNLVHCRGVTMTLLDFAAHEIAHYRTAATTRMTFPPGMRTSFEESPAIIPRLDQLRRGQVVVEEVQAFPPSPIRESALAEGQRLWVLVPLRVHGELIGALNLWYDNLNGFAEGEQTIVREVADSLSVAIEQMRLFEEVTAGRDRLRTLSQRLIAAQEDAQRSLARELHDQVSANLTALGINLHVMQNQLPGRTAKKVADRLADSLKLLDETIDRIGDVMTDLRPAILDDYGLEAALRWYAQQFSHRVGFEVKVQGKAPTPRLTSEVETALFRIVQEALTNVAKHAQASAVTLNLESAKGIVRLTIADNGIGFDQTKPYRPGDRQGLGLLSMRERAEAVAGHLRIESAPSQGTRVVVEVPR